MEQKQKSVYDLSKEEEEHSTLPTVRPATMYKATATSNPVMTRNLKKMAGKLSQKPLDDLLSHGYQDGNEAEMLLSAIGVGSGAGLHFDSSLFDLLRENVMHLMVLIS